MGWKRSDLIISTKIFFGYGRKEPNAKGLSRKHIIEGLAASLERLGMQYVDLVFAHRPDKTVTVEETVRAFNYCIDKGMAFYWGTSEWTAREIEEAHLVAKNLGLVGPVAEQCQYNLLHRERPEVEYEPVFEKYGMGTTIFSALASGILTGKYNDSISENTRFDNHKDFFAKRIKDLKTEDNPQIAKVKALQELAQQELGCSVTHLALAWVASRSLTSTVILGASSATQIVDNLKALDIIPKITPELDQKILEIVANGPKPEPRYRDDPAPPAKM